MKWNSCKVVFTKILPGVASSVVAQYCRLTWTWNPVPQRKQDRLQHEALHLEKTHTTHYLMKSWAHKKRKQLYNHLVQGDSAQQKPDPQTLWFHGQKTRWQNQTPTLDCFLCQRQKDVCSSHQVTSCEVAEKNVDLEKGKEKNVLLLLHPQQYKIMFFRYERKQKRNNENYVVLRLHEFVHSIRHLILKRTGFKKIGRKRGCQWNNNCLIGNNNNFALGISLEKHWWKKPISQGWQI